MKKQLALFLLAGLSAALGATLLQAMNSGPSSAPPVPRASSLQWSTDFAAAADLAKAQNKPLLLLFTGSDWCPACILMDKEVLSTRTFEDYAKKNLMLVLLDFPMSKTLPAEVEAQNKKLADKFKIEGYPTMILLNSQGDELAEMLGYQPGGPDTFIAQIKEVLAKGAGS
jgi:thioredoxin-related protein